ncbi:MAG TPA: hypothetical protein VHG10_00615 [Glycomyces sp.]|nr:hypothetical protein [Glycomyces sp.]
MDTSCQCNDGHFWAWAPRWRWAGASALGASPALAQQQYAVGVRRYDWTREGRPCTTYVYYPATGGNPVTGANGSFPVYNYTHGWLQPAELPVLHPAPRRGRIHRPRPALPVQRR